MIFTDEGVEEEQQRFGWCWLMLAVDAMRQRAYG
jgi:hypothetical protein